MTESLARDTIHGPLIAERRRCLLDCPGEHGSLPLSDIVSYDEDHDVVALADDADVATQHLSGDTRTEC